MHFFYGNVVSSFMVLHFCSIFLGEFMDMCPHGMGFTPDGQDIDDCLHTPNLCASGKCINTLGSFRCSCDHGFVPGRSKQSCVGKLFVCNIQPLIILLNSKFDCINRQQWPIFLINTITDVNECVAAESPCSFDCRNTPGGYECVCPQGYQLDRDGKGCVGELHYLHNTKKDVKK